MATSTTSSRIPSRPTKAASSGTHTGIPAPTRPELPTSLNNAPTRQSTVAGLASSLRQPTKTTSGLMKPTPVRNIISPTSSTNLVKPSQTKASSSSISHRLQPVRSTTTIRKPKALTTETNVNVFNTLPDDVGEIRRLLEQLLIVLQDPRANGQSDLELENRQLRREIAELKEKLRMARPDSTITRSRPKNSGIYSTPLLE